MKKILFVLLIVILLTGCKESPETDIVANKNENVLEQAVTEEAAAVVQEPVIDTKTDSFMVATGDLKVEVDAKVFPVSGPLSVVKVIPHKLTSEDLRLWGQVLFGDEEVYDPGAPKSKKELEEEILQWKQWRADAEAEGDEALVEDYDKSIANLEQDYEQAPEKAERLKTDYEFHSFYYYADVAIGHTEGDPMEKNMDFEAVTDYKDGIRTELVATERNAADYSMHYMAFYINLMNADVSRKLKTCSEEESFAMAESVREQLGLDDYACIGVENQPGDTVCAHRFYYTHCYQDVPTLKGYEIDLHSDDLYAANLYYEDFYIDVENGEIANVTLVSPMDIVEVENDNVKVLSFDEVYERFKSQMQSQYSKNTYVENGCLDENDEDFQNIEQMRIKITDIEQGMFRIKVKDSSEEFRMVPAWIFKGNTYCEKDFLASESYVIINALDGSVINPSLGY